MQLCASCSINPTLTYSIQASSLSHGAGTCRWLLLAKLEQQNGSVDGFISAQNQALGLQLALLEQLRDSSGVTAAAAGSGAGSTQTTRAKTKLGPMGDSLAVIGAGLASVGNTSSARLKAASICFDMAEHYRKNWQFDKVNKQ